MIERRTKAINIRPGISLSHSSELLRRRITDRSKACCIRKILLLKLPRRSEVNKRQVSVRLEHDIRWFHVPVYNCRISRMQIPQHIAQLLRPLNYQLLRLRAKFLQRLRQWIPLYVIHHNKKCIIILYYIDNARKVRMA